MWDFFYRVLKLSRESSYPGVFLVFLLLSCAPQVESRYVRTKEMLPEEYVSELVAISDIDFTRIEPAAGGDAVYNLPVCAEIEGSYPQHTLSLFSNRSLFSFDLMSSRLGQQNRDSLMFRMNLPILVEGHALRNLRNPFCG